MSSAGGSDPSGRTKPFFCYKCDEIISVSASIYSDPFCPQCLQGFLEECENRNPNSNPSLDGDPFAKSSLDFDPFSFLPFLLSSTSTTIDPHNSRLFSNSSASGSRSRTRPNFDGLDMFNPFAFLQNCLRDLQAGGANVQFEINHPSEPGFRFPGDREEDDHDGLCSRGIPEHNPFQCH